MSVFFTAEALSALGFPSTVVVNNTGSATAATTLGIYDARDGNKLGSYVTAAIPPNGQAMLTAAAIENGAHITPTPAMYHYVIKAEGAFTGFLQHLVSNTQVGVISDITAACALAAAGP